jgi:hypothetical protein
MTGLLLSLITHLIGIAMVAFGIFFIPKSGITMKLLSSWFVLSGISNIIIGYLFVRVVLEGSDVKKRIGEKILPSFFSPSSSI